MVSFHDIIYACWLRSITRDNLGPYKTKVLVIPGVYFAASLASAPSEHSCMGLQACRNQGLQGACLGSSCFVCGTFIAVLAPGNQVKNAGVNSSLADGALG